MEPLKSSITCILAIILISIYETKSIPKPNQKLKKYDYLPYNNIIETKRSKFHILTKSMAKLQDTNMLKHISQKTASQQALNKDETEKKNVYTFGQVTEVIEDANDKKNKEYRVQESIDNRAIHNDAEEKLLELKKHIEVAKLNNNDDFVNESIERSKETPENDSLASTTGNIIISSYDLETNEYFNKDISQFEEGDDTSIQKLARKQRLAKGTISKTKLITETNKSNETTSNVKGKVKAITIFPQLSSSGDIGRAEYHYGEHFVEYDELYTES